MYVLRYYIKLIEEIDQKRKNFFYFRKGIKIKKNRIQDTSTKKGLVPPRGGGDIFVYFVAPWRHGRVVRRGTANPFFPVQIRVSPDQQKMGNTLLPFC